MRRLVFMTISLLACLLGACQREPDFDTRYENAQRHIETRAKEIDRQLDGARAGSEPKGKKAQRGSPDLSSEPPAAAR